MPELPDVAGFKKYIDSTSLHQPIARTSVLDERILSDTSAQKLSRTLKDNTLEQTIRHGKFLFAGLERTGWLVLHFGMTGDLSYFPSEQDPPEYTKVLLSFENGHRLAYISRRMLGRVTVTDDREQFIEGQDLGPDALDPNFTYRDFADILAGRNSPIKSILMDQSAMAGVGNVYSDEALFQSGIHPEARPSDLTEHQQRKLFRTMRRVLGDAADRLGRVERLGDDFLLPHREEGADCPRCGQPIRKVTVSGRGSYYCPTCQPKPK